MGAIGSMGFVSHKSCTNLITRSRSQSLWLRWSSVGLAVQSIQTQPNFGTSVSRYGIDIDKMLIGAIP